MSHRVLRGVFDHEANLLGAVRELREANFLFEDIFSPFAVHGLEEAVGIRDTRIGWVCAIFGLAGAGTALAFQEWTSVFSWGLDVGGKPHDSLPAFVPVTFEVGVVCGALAVVLALFLRSGLYPGKGVTAPHPRSTNDRFVVVLDASRGGFDGDEARAVFRRHGATEIEEALWASKPGKQPAPNNLRAAS